MSWFQRWNFVSEFQNNYKVQDHLGSGAFGTVYKCRQTRFLSVTKEERVVAVKLVQFKEDKEEKVAQEVKLLRTLDHPNIIKIFKSWVELPPKGYIYHNRKTLDETSKGAIFIETEFCNLKSLRHWFTQAWRQKGHAKIMLYQIASGLEYLHGKNIIHRDLKPDNILLTHEVSSGYVIAKICDFGISTEVRTTMTSDIGTPGYMSPEMLRDTKYNEKVDVYSLGVIYCEMLVLGDAKNAELSSKLDIMRVSKNYESELATCKHLFDDQDKSLILHMVQTIAEKRPNTTEILQTLLKNYPRITNMKIFTVFHIHMFLSFEANCKNENVKRTLDVISFLHPTDIHTGFIIQLVKKLFSFDEKAFDILEEHFMCQRKQIEEKVWISVDPILQKVIRTKLEQEGKLVQILGEIIDITYKMSFAYQIEWSDLNHVETLWKHTAKIKPLVEKHNHLPVKIAYLFVMAGRYRDGLDFCCGAYEDLKSHLGIKHGSTLKIMFWKGAFHRYLEEYEDALKIQLEVYENQKSLFGEEDDDTLMAAREIGNVYALKGNLKEAGKWLSETLEKMARVNGKEHNNTLLVKNDLALVLQDLGKYEEAEKIWNEILTVREKVYGREHIETMTTKHNIAFGKEEQGKYEEALKIYEEVLEVKEKVLGKEHPKTLITKTKVERIRRKLARRKNL